MQPSTRKGKLRRRHISPKGVCQAGSKCKGPPPTSPIRSMKMSERNSPGTSTRCWPATRTSVTVSPFRRIHLKCLTSAKTGSCWPSWSMIACPIPLTNGCWIASGRSSKPWTRFIWRRITTLSSTRPKASVARWWTSAAATSSKSGSIWFSAWSGRLSDEGCWERSISSFTRNSTDFWKTTKHSNSFSDCRRNKSCFDGSIIIWRMRNGKEGGSTRIRLTGVALTTFPTGLRISPRTSRMAITTQYSSTNSPPISAVEHLCKHGISSKRPSKCFNMPISLGVGNFWLRRPSWPAIRSSTWPLWRICSTRTQAWIPLPRKKSSKSKILMPRESVKRVSSPCGSIPSTFGRPSIPSSMISAMAPSFCKRMRKSSPEAWTGVTSTSLLRPVGNWCASRPSRTRTTPSNWASRCDSPSWASKEPTSPTVNGRWPWDSCGNWCVGIFQKPSRRWRNGSASARSQTKKWWNGRMSNRRRGDGTPASGASRIRRSVVECFCLTCWTGWRAATWIMTSWRPERRTMMLTPMPNWPSPLRARWARRYGWCRRTSARCGVD